MWHDIDQSESSEHKLMQYRSFAQLVDWFWYSTVTGIRNSWNCAKSPDTEWVTAAQSDKMRALRTQAFAIPVFSHMCWLVLVKRTHRFQEVLELCQKSIYCMRYSYSKFCMASHHPLHHPIWHENSCRFISWQLIVYSCYFTILTLSHACMAHFGRLKTVLGCAHRADTVT